MQIASIARQAGRIRHGAVATFERFPWIGWVAWVAFCINSLLRTHPRRFGSTFGAYLEYARQYWTEQPIYDPNTLGDYLYWPVSLVLFRPLLALDPTAAAAVAMLVSAAVLSWASIALLQALFPKPHAVNVTMLAGILLLINIPTAWYNFKYVQAQIMMTAFMMLAAAAIMRAQWRLASFWLFASAVIKPLSLVMILLCAALAPRMRLALAAAIVAGLLLPFVFVDAGYLAAEYEAWMRKLWHLGSASPREWPYQADFVTMFDTVGIVFPPLLATVIRVSAALATLGLAWRISRTQTAVVFAIGVLLLSGCYITLFGPRNEFLSFLVLTPPLTALALLILIRNEDDWRGWLLIAAVLIMGFHCSLAVDRVVKPALVSAVYGWLIWLTILPQRWRDLMPASGAQPLPSAN